MSKETLPDSSNEPVRTLETTKERKRYEKESSEEAYEAQPIAETRW
jgi:hypothetical protein